MIRSIIQLFIVFTLLFQGVVTVAAASLPAHSEQQHCAGHDKQKETCPCCPKGMDMGAACTAQCSVTQAPQELFAELQPCDFEVSYFFAHRLIRDPAHAPPVPPPIV